MRLLRGYFCMPFRGCFAQDSLQKDVLKRFYDFFPRIRARCLVPLVGPIQHSEQRIRGYLWIDVLYVILLHHLTDEVCRHPDIFLLAAVDSGAIARRQRLALMKKAGHFKIPLFKNQAQMEVDHGSQPLERI